MDLNDFISMNMIHLFLDVLLIENELFGHPSFLGNKTVISIKINWIEKQVELSFILLFKFCKYANDKEFY